MRRATPADLTAQIFDCIVIGGGVNGVAIARDAAMRGFSVALLEQDDLSSGTSAWSSRMIHGGLRYLEHAEFGLVHESLEERERLLHNAPHLVTPLQTLVPIYRGARRGAITVRAGMILYDSLSLGKSLPRHRMLAATEVEQRATALRTTGLRAGALYYDAQVTFAERLVIELAESATRFGAQIATRCPVTAITTDGAVVTGVTATDLTTGTPIAIHGRQVVNVAGPWVDQVLTEVAGYRSPHKLIGGTRGSHLVVDAWPGAPDDTIYTEAHSDGRPVLVIPWNGMMLLGSTDVRFEGDPGAAIATAAEVTYLLAEVNRLFPTANLTPASIRYTYAGIRPLPRTQSGREGAITRRHIVKDHAPAVRGLFSIIGGKLTTHRSLAEQVVDKVATNLGSDARSTTARAPLPGSAWGPPASAEPMLARLLTELNMDPGAAARFASTYGSLAADLLAPVLKDTSLGQPVAPGAPLVGAEIEWAVNQEMAMSITDLLMRRTMVGFGPNLGQDLIAPVADRLASLLNWSKPERERHILEHQQWLLRLQPEPPTRA